MADVNLVIDTGIPSGNNAKSIKDANSAPQNTSALAIGQTNVGVGTTTPGAKLEVQGEAAVSGTQNAQTAAGGSISITTTNNAFADVQVGALITANNQTVMVTEKASSTSLTVDKSVNWYNGGAGYAFTYKNPILKISDNGTCRFITNANGNMGFGVVAPPPSATPATNVTNINAAIAAVTFGDNAGTVYLQEGTYEIDSAISLKSSLKLIGAGMGKTIIKINSANAVIALNTVCSASFISIKDLTINSEQTHPGNLIHTAIFLNQTEFVNIENVDICDMDTGIVIMRSYNNLRNIQVQYCHTGVLLGKMDSPSTQWASANTFFGGKIAFCYSYGMRFCNAAGNFVFGMTIEANMGGGVILEKNMNTYGDNSLIGCYIELNGSYQIRIDSQDNRIIGNHLARTNGYGPLFDWVSGDGVNDGNVIAGNYENEGASQVRKEIYLSSVGIGTNSPDSKLDVRGNVSIQNEAGGATDDIMIKRIGDLSNSNINFVISNRDGQTLWLFGSNGTTFRSFAGFDYANYKINFPANGVTLVIDETNGLVGIGTTTPTQPLQIAGALAVDFSVSGSAYQNWVENKLYSAIYMSEESGSNGYPFNLNGHLIIQPRTSAARDIVFATNNGSTTPSVSMIIQHGGSVGIGVTSPTSGMKLDVNGNIRAAGRFLFAGSVPGSAVGGSGDVAGMIAVDASYLYVCKGTYDGTTHIWTRTALTTW